MHIELSVFEGRPKEIERVRENAEKFEGRENGEEWKGMRLEEVCASKGCVKE